MFPEYTQKNKHTVDYLIKQFELKFRINNELEVCIIMKKKLSSGRNQEEGDHEHAHTTSSDGGEQDSKKRGGREGRAHVHSAHSKTIYLYEACQCGLDPNSVL